MRTITVVAEFKADIPDDMDSSEIQELAYSKIQQKCEDFRIMVESYLDINEEEAEPYFSLNDVMAGETVMIAIG